VSKFTLIEYNNSYYGKWNDFIKNSNNGNIFHRLDFLSYHGDKFKENENHLIWLKGEHIFAVMPMAVFEIGGKKIAKSPYGASFGGIVTRDVVNYKDSNELVKSLIDYIKQHNIDELIITPSTLMLNKIKSETLNFSFLEQGFKFTNNDITNFIEINQTTNIENELLSKNARNMLRKAIKNNVKVKSYADINDFWKVMDSTFQKHGKSPTHTKSEWENLISLFPESIWCDVAYLDNIPISGIGQIKLNPNTYSSFYLCNDIDYIYLQGQTLLIYESLLKMKEENIKYYDFGTSSVSMVGRENIFNFKEGFGALGTFRNSFKYIND